MWLVKGGCGTETQACKATKVTLSIALLPGSHVSLGTSRRSKGSYTDIETVPRNTGFLSYPQARSPTTCHRQPRGPGGKCLSDPADSDLPVIPPACPRGARPHTGQCARCGTYLTHLILNVHLTGRSHCPRFAAR